MAPDSNLKTALKIYPLGFDERGRQTLMAFFTRQLAGVCEMADDDDDAHAILIDGDNYHAKKHLIEQREKSPQKPIILLTLTPEQATTINGVVVKKPIIASLFAAQLYDLANQLLQPQEQHQDSLEQKNHSANAQSTEKASRVVDQSKLRKRHYYVGSMPDVDLSVTTERSKIFYDPNNFLQGHITRAVAIGHEKGSAVRVTGRSFQDIIIYPSSNRISYSADLRTLCTAARLPITEKDIRINFLPNGAQQLDEKITSESIEDFIWKLALWAARGRLPVGADLHKQVTILRWPNLTRLLVPPNTLRILGLWSRPSHSLANTPIVLGIPQRYVFAIFSACIATNLVVTASCVTDHPITPKPPVDQERRGIFQMLFKKLITFRNVDEPSS